MHTKDISVYYLKKKSMFNYNKSLIDIHDKFDYNIINTKSILYFLKYNNTIISKDTTDK